MSRPLEWLRAHDPGYGAARRGLRAAVVMTSLLAIATQVIDNVEVATFAAFGSFAMLLLVEFTGPIRDRIRDQAALGVCCVVMICLGILVSRTTWLAVAGMVILGFGVLFAGVISSVIARATISLLLAFILPVTLRLPPSAIPECIAGWGLAAAASIPAISLLWPSSATQPFRDHVIATCRTLAARLHADVEYVLGPASEAAAAAHRAAVERAADAVQGLLGRFFATPFRPSGLSTEARAVVRLVDDLRWLESIARRAAPGRPATHDLPVCAVKSAAADVLDCAADLLDAPRAPEDPLTAATARLHETLVELERATTTSLPVAAAPHSGQVAPDSGHGAANGRGRAVVSALDPSFRAQELSFVVGQIAANTAFAAAAARRGWVARLLGRQPEGLAGPLAAAQERAASYAGRRSVWLQNSVRGAVALGLAVLVADVSGVQHGFWVAFGTLSVLRSNALSTGENVLRALVGTAVGFAVGGALVYLIGTNTAVLWAVLPFVVLLAGMAPAVISFAAGQASFTLTLLILFNVIVPAGWRLGLVRIEDVAIGGAVSLVIGALFWPRGAGAALGRALSDAYAECAAYLVGAVAYGVERCDGSGPPAPVPREPRARAASASRRLDDAFRGYLLERGAKPASLRDVTGLVTGASGMRLACDAILDLWETDGAQGGDRAAARTELLAASGHVAAWLNHFAGALAGREELPGPPAADGIADGRLVVAVDRDLRDPDGYATATAVRVIWTGDHLDAVRRLEEMLVAPARAAVTERSRH